MPTASASSTSTSVTSEFCWAKLVSGAGAAMARPSQADPAKMVQAMDSHEDRLSIRILQTTHAATEPGGGKRADSGNSRLWDVFRGFYLDAEAGDTDIGGIRRYQQPDSGNAEILQNLCAKADLAPLLGTCAFRRVFRPWNGGAGHPGAAVLQINDDAAAFFLDLGHRLAENLRAAQHVANHVAAMQSRQHRSAVADVAQDEGHVADLIEGRDIGKGAQLADLRRYGEFSDTFHQLVACLSIRDQISDGDALELVLLGEGGELRPAHHGAVVVHQLRQHADGRKTRKPAEIDTGLRVAGAHQHPALLGDERKDMAGPHKIRRAAIAIGQPAHGIGAFFGRDAGG